MVTVIQAEAEYPAGLRDCRAEIAGLELRSGAVLQRPDGLHRRRAGLEKEAERCQPRVTGRIGDVNIASASPDVQAQSASGHQGCKPHLPGLLFGWLSRPIG